MTDDTIRDILTRLETQEAELARYRAERAARRPPRAPRPAGGPRSGARHPRLVAALALALLIALVPASLLAAVTFSDLNTAGPEFRPAIGAIADAGITVGRDDPNSDDPNVKLYDPKANVTREQMAIFLAKTAGLGGNPPVANAATAVNATNATNAATAQTVPDGAITPAKLGAGAAAAGQVLTANGAGGVAFQPLPPPPTNADTIDGYNANDLTRLAAAQGPGAGTTIPMAGYANVVAVELTVPRRSQVRVSFSGTAFAPTTAGCPCVLLAALFQDGDLGGHAVARTNLATEGTDIVNGQDRRPISGATTFVVDPGTYTFRLQVFREFGTSVNIGVYDVELHAELFPFNGVGNAP